MDNSELKRCVHCLGYFTDAQLTDDHVVPDSWYPPEIPRGARPVVPACIPCNRNLGKTERALGVLFGLCMSPEDPLGGYFARKAARAANPRFGASVKDRTHRLQLREKITRNWLTDNEVVDAAVIPGFERTPESDESDLRAVGMPKAVVDAFGEKLVRGSSYLFSHLYIEPGHQITTEFMRPAAGKVFSDALDKFGRRMDLAPGMSLRRAGDAPEDPACGLFEFKFWGRLYIYGAVTRPDLTQVAETSRES